jgi:hypothetical protein
VQNSYCKPVTYSNIADLKDVCGWYRRTGDCTIKHKIFSNNSRYCFHPKIKNHEDCPVWQFRFNQELFKTSSPNNMRLLRIDASEGVPGAVSELGELIILASRIKHKDKLTGLTFEEELGMQNLMLQSLENISSTDELRLKYDLPQFQTSSTSQDYSQSFENLPLDFAYIDEAESLQD